VLVQIQPSAEQRTWHDRASAAAREILAPRAEEIDREGRLPAALLEALGAQDLLLASVPEAAGGGGAGRLALLMLLEELAAACTSTAAAVGVTSALVGEALASGQDDRRALLAELGRGARRCCVAGVAGALPSLEGGRLRGSCAAVGAAQAELCLVQATEDGDARCLLVSISQPGVERQAGSPLGVRGFAAGELSFDCEVGTEALVCAGPSAGLAPRSALVATGLSLGVARAALAEAISRAKADRALGKQQLIQFKLADMATRLDGARLIGWRAATEAEGHLAARQAAMAKLMASEAAAFVSKEAVQICGGAGYLKDSPVERYFRDAKACELIFGTSEHQRLQIATSLTRD
jgi:alkylation response protein AidB-like acyl-CoA dehydrogenase